MLKLSHENKREKRTRTLAHTHMLTHTHTSAYTHKTRAYRKTNAVTKCLFQFKNKNVPHANITDARGKPPAQLFQAVFISLTIS